ASTGFLSYPKGIMATNTNYTNACANLATLLKKVAADREIVIIDWQGSESVALIAESELSSLMETAHLLRSPKNARRLLTALRRAATKRLAPRSVDELRREMGIARAR